MSESSDVGSTEAANELTRGGAYGCGSSRSRTRFLVVGTLLSIAAAVSPAALVAQENAALPASSSFVPGVLPPFESAPPTRADSLAANAARAAAAGDRRLRIVVSIDERRLVVLDGTDTLSTAPAAVGMDRRLTFGGHSWTFRSPRGARVVMRKSARESWVPPDWHYAEVAREHRLRLAHLDRERAVLLQDGSILTTQGGKVGLLRSDGSFAPLPPHEEIVFDGTLYIPPIGTENRAIPGELGEYQLDLGDGYLIHGTPRKESIGTASTHGCVRVDDAEIAWLYSHIPVGTPVYIY